MDIEISLILVLAAVISGVVTLVDHLFFASQRNEKISQLEIAVLHDLASEEDNGKQQQAKAFDSKELRKQNTPVIVDYSRSLFPVLFLVLIIRSFFFEPYQIPSGSMLPTLKIGDFILVDKYSFGIRLPVINTEVLAGRDPQAGEVLVFRAPFEPHTNFIKRVIGVPGDRISIKNNELYINGQRVGQGMVTQPLTEDNNFRFFQQSIGDHSFLIQQGNLYSSREGEWLVPQDSFFVLGDNRGNSRDSRYWGFVPRSMIVGRAFYVWMHWNQFFSIPSFSSVGSIDENF